MSYFHETEFEIWAGFGAVLGWPAVLIFLQEAIFFFMDKTKKKLEYNLHCFVHNKKLIQGFNTVSIITVPSLTWVFSGRNDIGSLT